MAGIIGTKEDGLKELDVGFKLKVGYAQDTLPCRVQQLEVGRHEERWPRHFWCCNHYRRVRTGRVDD